MLMTYNSLPDFNLSGDQFGKFNHSCEKIFGNLTILIWCPLGIHPNVTEDTRISGPIR